MTGYSEDFLNDRVMQKLPAKVREFLLYDAPTSFSPEEVLDLLEEHGEQGLMDILHNLIKEYATEDYKDPDHKPLSATPGRPRTRAQRRRRH